MPNVICIKIPSQKYSAPSPRLLLSRILLIARSLCTNKMSPRRSSSILFSSHLGKTKVSILECVVKMEMCVHIDGELFVIHSQPPCPRSQSTHQKKESEEEKWMSKWLVGNSWVDWHLLMKYSQFIWRHKKVQWSVLSIFYLAKERKWNIKAWHGRKFWRTFEELPRLDERFKIYGCSEEF